MLLHRMSSENIFLEPVSIECTSVVHVEPFLTKIIMLALLTGPRKSQSGTVFANLEPIMAEAEIQLPLHRGRSP